jgi:hypothetical protein
VAVHHGTLLWSARGVGDNRRVTIVLAVRVDIRVIVRVDVRVYVSVGSDWNALQAIGLVAVVASALGPFVVVPARPVTRARHAVTRSDRRALLEHPMTAHERHDQGDDLDSETNHD